MPDSAVQESPAAGRAPAARARAAGARTTLLHGGDFLFHMGERLGGVFLVSAGSLKLLRTTASGDAQIIGFYGPADVVGLDALSDGVSRSEAVALNTASVQFVSWSQLRSGKRGLDRGHLLTLAGQELIRENDLALVLSRRTAERRLAWFLVDYSDRLAARRLTADEFTLPMSRTDIALYLGLALETVCRELARLQDRRLITKQRRRIRLLDLPRLRNLGHGAAP